MPHGFDWLLSLLIAVVAVETTSVLYRVQTFGESTIAVEILTVLAVLPFLAALVVGAREAEQDQR